MARAFTVWVFPWFSESSVPTGVQQGSILSRPREHRCILVTQKCGAPSTHNSNLQWIVPRASPSVGPLAFQVLHFSHDDEAAVRPNYCVLNTSRRCFPTILRKGLHVSWNLHQKSTQVLSQTSRTGMIRGQILLQGTQRGDNEFDSCDLIIIKLKLGS